MIIIKILISFYKRIKRRWLLAKAALVLEEELKKKKMAMAKLRIEINHALGFDFFRINAKSEYIPPQFKSKAKVLAFVESKFGTKMEDIGVTIDDLFKS